MASRSCSSVHLGPPHLAVDLLQAVCGGRQGHLADSAELLLLLVSIEGLAALFRVHCFGFFGFVPHFVFHISRFFVVRTELSNTIVEWLVG